jgi:RNA polymerase sigma factor (sigma-70 family)
MYLYGRDQELREDLPGVIYCQFADLVERYDEQRGVPLRAYLVHGIRWAVYTYIRSERNRQAHFTLAEAAELCSDDPTPGWVDTLRYERVRETLPELIQALAPRQRKALIQRYYDECEYEEIAADLGVTPASARSLVRHAMSNLRRHFEGE